MSNKLIIPRFNLFLSLLSYVIEYTSTILSDSLGKLLLFRWVSRLAAGFVVGLAALVDFI